MLQTITRPVAAAPVVSLLAACAYCPASTGFACLRCSVPMCPDCCPGDYCPDCQPAPVAPALDWQTERYGYVADVAIVACAGCDAPVANPDDAAEVFCLACDLTAAPAPVARRCQMCAGILAAADATRCATCQRFMTRLDERHAAWREERIAA